MTRKRVDSKPREVSFRAGLRKFCALGKLQYIGYATVTLKLAQKVAIIFLVFSDP